MKHRKGPPNVHANLTTLNASQQHRLLVTCKHIDKLLGDIEATLDSAASKSVFATYVPDITPIQQKAVKDHIAQIRGQLLQVLARESLAPEQPHISAAHSIAVNLSFIDIAITELAPRYMRGYGPLSEEGAADLNGIVTKLGSGVKELTQYLLARKHGPAGESEKSTYRKSRLTRSLREPD